MNMDTQTRQHKQHSRKLLISFALVGLIAAGIMWGIIPWIAESRFQQMLTYKPSHVGNGGRAVAQEIAGLGGFGLPAICRHLQSSDASERRAAAYVLIFYGRQAAQGCRAAMDNALKSFDEQSRRQEHRGFYVGSFSVATLLVEKAYTSEVLDYHDSNLDEQARIHLHTAMALAASNPDSDCGWLKSYAMDANRTMGMRGLAIVCLGRLRKSGVASQDIASFLQSPGIQPANLGNLAGLVLRGTGD